MDINSLLSPQETPRATPTPPVKSPAKKPRKSRTSKVAQPSPLARTTLPPPSLPHNALVQAQHALPSPTTMSPTLGHHMSSGTAITTPPVDSTTRTSRQSSTAGMDTLADLASMQHHQQTARANAGGLRRAEVYDNSNSSSSVAPPLHAMSRPPVSTQFREPNLLRGSSSLDFIMTDGSTDIPPPRKYSTIALSPEELETVTQLATHLKSSPFAYHSHVQLINLLHRGLQNLSHSEPHTYNLLKDLQSARETMNASFALGEDLWFSWIQDQILLATSLEDRITVMELCQKAVEEEPGSTKIWESYGQFMLFLYKSSHPEDRRLGEIGPHLTGNTWSEEDMMVAQEVFNWQQMISVWNKGSNETTFRLSDSHVLWDTHTELLLQDLASSPSQKAVAGMQSHFTARLQIPHSTWDKTFAAYSNFISQYDNNNYETTMKTTNREGAEARQKSGAREIMELQCLRASQANDKDQELLVYHEYLEWELAQSRKKNIFDFGLACALYQRTTLLFPANTDLWEGYAMFMIEETTHVRQHLSAFPVLERATRHCPWSGKLWSQYLLAAENNNLSFTEVEDIKHRATSSGLLDAGGMEEVLKIHTAWCGFLRRRAFRPGSTDEDIDVAEVGIRSAIENMENLGIDKYGKDYQGDPQYRLEKIYIKYLSQGRNWESARDEYRKLIPRKGDNWDFWLRYYLWEMGTWGKRYYSDNGHNGKEPTKPTEATKVLARAMSRSKLDWPEKIIETYQYHCEDNEDAVELQSSIARIWKAKKDLQKRREREQYEAYEATQAQAIPHQQQSQQSLQDPMTSRGEIEGEKASKRKREDDVEAGMSKKIRPDAFEETEPQVEEQHPSAPSLLKRDRENATIVVKNLPLGVSDTRLRQFFRDCGTINSLKITPEKGHQSATASIEFDSKEDVLSAQTKDMKMFDDRAIEVQVGSGSTLYVCNFPPTADEAWIRHQFSKYGEIVDIRFPSLKFNTHRRFCYVQFKISSDAQAATELDGKELGSNLHLSAKISDPRHKQERNGAIYEGRELYLANLDWKAKEKDLTEAFSKYGKVERVRIPKKVNGMSKGIGYVVFSQREEAEAALEMNLTQFENRILNVTFSTNDKAKRQETRIITSTSQRTTASPGPDHPTPSADGDVRSTASPAPSGTTQSKYAEIQSRTIALLNIPDTVNEARIRALAEQYGELVKVSLRLDHQGVILEYKDAASVGKASLGLEGREIVPGRPIGVGTVSEMKMQKSEYRSDKMAVGVAKKEVAKLQGPVTVRRPNQPGARRGGRGGLGFKRDEVGPKGGRGAKDGHEEDQGAIGEGMAAEDKGKAKSNDDFKAMFLRKEGE